MASPLRLYLSFLLILLLNHVTSLAQHSVARKPTNREIDSIQMLQQFHRLQLNTRKPFFEQKNNTRFTGRNLQRPVTGKPLDQSDCLDTSSRFFLPGDSINFYVGESVRSSDGYLLLPGEYYNYKQIPGAPPYTFTDKGFLIKCDDYGNVVWAKLYDSASHEGYSFINYYTLIELQDGSILMAGITTNLKTLNNDFIMTKVDNSGNLIWSKIYASRLWTPGSSGSADYFFVQQMKEDPFTGDVFMTGPNWDAGRNIIKMDAANGNILWSKVYQQSYGGGFDRPFGLGINATSVVSIGRFSNGDITYLSAFSINKSNGDTIRSRLYTVTDSPHLQRSFLTADPLTTLKNGNYAVSGELYGFYQYQSNNTSPFYQAGVAEIDSNLNFVKAYCFRNNTPSNSYNTATTVFPDGTGLFYMLETLPFSGYSSNTYYVQFNNGAIQKNRKNRLTNDGFPSENPAIRLPDGGLMTIKLTGDSINNSSSIGFLKLHASDTSSDCLGKDDEETFTEPFTYSLFPYPAIDSVGENIFHELPNKTITAESFTLNNKLPGCEQTAFCDSLKLRASNDTLCPFMPLILTVTKNRECGSIPIFNYDTTRVQSFTRVKDSLYQVVFNGAWQGNIGVSIAGCRLLTDSLKITVLASPPFLNLGPDTVICQGNSFILNARKGYATYQWQDGSADSVFTVTRAGTYFVKTTNACGGIFADTVIVLPHPVIPFDLGADVTICRSDSVQVIAPPGFISYTWLPDYHISSVNSQSVTLDPVTDTIYKVKAEKSTGCFAYDSIRVIVKQRPSIFLGNDTSFCNGDSLELNAGQGFDSYLWNNNTTSQHLTVFSAGSYSVTGTTATGCKAADTISVLQVFNNPVVELGTDSILCVGSSRTLDAGNFQQYLWSTGSVSQSVVVNGTGIYSVTVTDSHQCKASDTIYISKPVTPPAGFLPRDTAVCTYGTLTITATNRYARYLWNNNVTSPSIDITQPGLYWLQVTDVNNCKGSDSIIIGAKDCLLGFYIPTAFTPNSDSRNDNFKPLIFGNVSQYEFLIFNRYGQAVFKTNELNRGWTGDYQGASQKSGSYVWVCKYRLNGQSLETRKGSVVLMR